MKPQSTGKRVFGAASRGFEKLLPPSKAQHVVDSNDPTLLGVPPEGHDDFVAPPRAFSKTPP